MILKPIIKMNDGVTDLERTRTLRGSYQRLMDLVAEKGELEQIAFVHTHALEKIEKLKKDAAHFIPKGSAAAGGGSYTGDRRAYWPWSSRILIDKGRLRSKALMIRERSSMILAKIIAALGALAQGIVLVYGFTRGDFSAAGSFFFSDPWGIVSLVDVYVGFIFFCAWVIYREEKLWKALVWTLSIMILGNFPAGIYAFLALHNSDDKWMRFWMGKHYQDSKGELDER